MQQEAGAGLGEYVATVRFVSFHSATALGAALPTSFLQKLANLSALYLTACGLTSIQGILFWGPYFSLESYLVISELYYPIDH